jgi:ASC-1-like (ASCH) protein
MTRWTIHVSEPWFTQIRLGNKQVEGKKNSRTWEGVVPGDVLKFTDNQIFVYASVKSIRRYFSVEAYLMYEGLRRTLPGVQSIEEGLSVYLKPNGFWEPSEVQQYGILAIEFSLI